MLAKDVNKEYLPIDGLPEMRSLAAKLVYGVESAPLAEGRVAIAQSVSGTGALRLAMQLLAAQVLPSPLVAYVSDPTWGNHKKILTHTGYEVRAYRYYDAENRCVNVQGMLEDLRAAPRGALIVLQACAHNPTGYDLTEAQWDEVYAVVCAQGLFALFDMAYQGFATGDLERDATSIRRFVATGAQAAVCQSFAKNFGLYGERCGTVSFVAASQQEAQALQSQLKAIIRPMYSNPPKVGNVG
jgi:aspartate aminotransferase, mitochondrial